MKISLTSKEKKCPKCSSEDITFYPLAYYHDYKCNVCGNRFDEEDLLPLAQSPRDN
jgi:transposase-like protein